MKESACERGGHQHAHFCTSVGMSPNRNVSGIAAKSSDVPLDPLERRDLIESAVISRGVMRRFCCECRVRHVSQGADAKYHTDDHYAFAGKRWSKQWLPAIARKSSSTMEAHHHWNKRFLPQVGRPNIQIQTVFGRSEVF
jgi:hypothetical protein